MELKDAVIVAYGRSPCCKARKGGYARAGMNAIDFTAQVVRGVLDKVPQLKPEMIDDFIFGTAATMNALAQNAGRNVVHRAQLPDSVPAITINRYCSTGLQAMADAANAIRTGEMDVVMVCGAEDMTNSFGPLDPTYMNKWLLEHRPDSMVPMGITAENVAERFGVTREMQDEFSANSQHKYGVAAAAGKFDEEIVPVMVKVKKEMVEFKVDEQPRPDSTAEKLANLKPAFKRDGGTVTAGNASGINDGAAALVIMSAEKAKELGVKPLAKIVTGASAGVDPSIMGIGPVYATRKALKKANLELKDIDLIEANEAFAAQSVAVANELGFDMDKVNVNGGAVALGHPIGASGCRLLVTLLYEMKRRNAKYGLATLCVGGGMGVATIVEGM